MMTVPSEDHEMTYVCSYTIGGLSDIPTRCGNVATHLVVWPPEITDQTTMTYCRVHYKSVQSFLDRAVDDTDLNQYEC